MNQNPWGSSKEASDYLGVTERTLKSWREVGYLKPGTHWRSSDSSKFLPWTPEVLYHLAWCKEEMDYWRSHHAAIKDIAA